MAGVIALAGAVVAIGVIGNPIGWAGDRWEDFKSGEFEQEFEGSRLSQGSAATATTSGTSPSTSSRTRRSAGLALRTSRRTTCERNSDEEPPSAQPLADSRPDRPGRRRSSSVSGRGSDRRGRTRLRSSDPLGRGVGGLAAVVFVYWFAHSTGDWFWLFPPSRHRSSPGSGWG